MTNEGGRASSSSGAYAGREYEVNALSANLRTCNKKKHQHHRQKCAAYQDPFSGSPGLAQPMRDHSGEGAWRTCCAMRVVVEDMPAAAPSPGCIPSKT